MRDEDHRPRHLARPSTTQGRGGRRRRGAGSDGPNRQDPATWPPPDGNVARRRLLQGGEGSHAPVPSPYWAGPAGGWASDEADSHERTEQAPERDGSGDGARRPSRSEARAAAGGDDGFDDVEPSTPSDDEPPSTGRRRWPIPAWAVPVVLGVGAVAALAGAVLLDEHPSAEAVGAPMTPTTPVFSLRRVPEVIAAPVANRRLTADLQGWIGVSPPSSCLVVESGDDALFVNNPTLPVAGASTQKIVTASALLLALGPDGRLETVVSAASPPSNGVVAGDLFVVGGGDPLLTSPGYAESLVRDPTLGVDPIALADAIVNAGVRQVTGSVVGDGSRYDVQRFHPTWPDRYRAQGNVGPVGALTVNDGVAGSDGRSRPPAGAAGGDPAANAATVVTDLLRLRGVVVGGPPRTGVAPEGATQVTTFASPTAREIAAEMLTDSDNDTAEMALKEVGRRESGDGSWEGGAAAATAVLSEAGVGLEGVQIVDGSGLSTANRLTCQLLVDLLTHPETGQTVVGGLAIAGQTGTLQDRWGGTQVLGRLAGKTGTLNSVTALSGRVSPLQGGALSFAYVANVPEGQSLAPGLIGQQDRLGEILVAYPRGVDVNTLVPAMPAPTS